MNVRKGFFKDWKIGNYYATKTGFSLWIRNGFSSFEDGNNEQPFLSLCDYWTRRKLWRELKREKKRRLREFLK